VETNHGVRFRRPTEGADVEPQLDLVDVHLVNERGLTVEHQLSEASGKINEVAFVCGGHERRDLIASTENEAVRVHSAL
jgi:hypothetical protein